MPDINNKNFCQNTFLIIPTYVVNHSKVDAPTALLFGQLNFLSNEEGFCSVSNKYLSSLCGCSERELIYRLNTLEEHGFIKNFKRKIILKWERRIYTCNNYRQINDNEIEGFTSKFKNKEMK